LDGEWCEIEVAAENKYNNYHTVKTVGEL